jgi:DNA-binding transcriptional LysR family regulator
MELRHLRYFLAVAEDLNFRRAAEKLRIAQSPLSQQIKSLEHELGFELFTRTRRRVQLTHAGKVFAEEARQLLTKAKEATVRAKKAADGEAGTLTIGYLTSMTNYTFSRILSEFQRHCPEVDLVMNDLTPLPIIDGVRERRIDVGFMRFPMPDRELATEEIWKEPLVVALPKGHWLEHQAIIQPRNLKDEVFVMVPEYGSGGLNDAIRAVCLAGGFSPKVRAEANQLQAAIWSVHVGLGIAIVPETLRHLHRDNVQYRPLRQSPLLPASMVWHQENTSPVLTRFRQVAHATVRSEKKSRGASKDASS